jgi:hypothetical protein
MSSKRPRDFTLVWIPAIPAKIIVHLRRETLEYYGKRFSQIVTLDTDKGHLFRWDYRENLWTYADFGSLPDTAERQLTRPRYFAVMPS